MFSTKKRKYCLFKPSIMTELPKLEVNCYIFIWISGVIVSLYRLYLVGQVFDHQYHDEYHYEDFRKGWALLGGRYLDQADYEWNAWTNLFKNLFPFLFINLVGAEWLRLNQFLYVLPVWYTMTTISFLLIYFKAILTLWFVSQTLIYAVVIYYKSYIFIWIVSFVIIHFLKPDIWFLTNEEDQYLIMVSSSWMVLRCISFSVDNLDKSQMVVNNKSSKISNILLLLGYSFYLPTMFCGPFISYHYFDEAVNKKKIKWSCKRALTILHNFARCIFWYFFTVFALHFIYVNAILLRPELVKRLLDWELAGLGIAMGHFFHLKYIVFYGIPCAWAAAEGFVTPRLPCCVSRVHLYSYMWRHFDNGLYQFLVRYIYIPIIKHVRGHLIMCKILASIGCFTFMFTWHREQDYVFFWVLFNFMAVTLELAAKQIYSLPSVQATITRHISSRNQTRLQCVLAAPLHCFSMVSNYFFIGNGMEVGLIYLNRIFYGSYVTKMTVLFFLYGAGQSAVATQKREEKNKQS